LTYANLTARHNLFLEIWKGRTNSRGILQHPLLSYTKDSSLQEVSDAGIEFGNDQTWIFEYVAQIMCWERVARAVDDGSGFNPAEYVLKHVLILEAMSEAWPAERIVGFNDGQKKFDLLAMKVADLNDVPVVATSTSTDDTKKAVASAAELVWTALSQASMQKVHRGVQITPTDSLGVLWDKAENNGKDFEPGTFAELLRYGALHFRQTRERLTLLPPVEKPEIGNLWEP
jgi:hypothetical protein